MGAFRDMFASVKNTSIYNQVVGEPIATESGSRFTLRSCSSELESEIRQQYPSAIFEVNEEGRIGSYFLTLNAGEAARFHDHCLQQHLSPLCNGTRISASDEGLFGEIKGTIPTSDGVKITFKGDKGWLPDAILRKFPTHGTEVKDDEHAPSPDPYQHLAPKDRPPLETEPVVIRLHGVVAEQFQEEYAAYLNRPKAVFGGRE
ncbi:MAG: hypothetical protein V4735_04270 [Pseudomonadota bacterium]